MESAMINRRAIMRQWADATRHYRWDEAEALWRELMAEWLRPPVIDQSYWNDLIDRRMAVLERKERRSTITDDEWDNTHQDMNR
jgi:hypothetical protein